MLYLVYGGSGSGKSAYAERIVMESGKEERYYVATMQVFGKEGQAKVERHKRLRQGKGFVTIEQPTDLQMAIQKVDRESKEKGSIALLECMSNLVANEMFGEDTMKDCSFVVEKVIREVKAFRAAVDDLVIVTNNVFEDGISYDEETRQYMEALGQINSFLARKADHVTEVVVGIPLKLK